MFENILTAQNGMAEEQKILFCILSALIIGFFIAAIYLTSPRRSKSMLLSLCVLPLLVQVVIIMVNGNVGAGVAVMGAFNLVRFRSLPGKSIDIVYIFYAMAAGIIVGMGYLYFAAAITVVLGAVLVLGELVMGKMPDSAQKDKLLRITIPEDMDYGECFEDIFQSYTASHELERVKTTNLGMMFELVYTIRLKDAKKEKEMIDSIRVRNGNLQIICGKIPAEDERL